MKRYLHLILFILCWIISFESFSQQFNRPVPSDLFQYEYSNLGFQGTGYFHVTPFKLNILPSDPNYINPYTILLDSDGYIAWYTHPDIGNMSDFKYYPEVDLFSYTIWDQGEASFIILDGGLNHLDTLNTLIAEEDTHDLQRANNGNWLLSARFYDTVDLSAYMFDGVQGSAQTVIRGYGVQEFNASGSLVFEWNSNDHISPTETYDHYGYNVNDFDYCHGNAIEEDTDGNLLFSFRHLNAIYKVDRTNGNVIWSLGGNSSSFTFPNDSGFSGQHDIRKLANGYYSLFDNSNMGSTPKKSRGVEYALDTINWVATKVNEFIHPMENYHRAMGNYSNMSNGNKLLGYGFSKRPAPTASVFDDNHNLLSEFYFADSVMSYRFHYFELPNFVQPEITCMLTASGYELTAPNAASYEWSTGETTQSITLASAGTFQVWIPYGDGFISSVPFSISDVQNPCGNVGVEEPEGHNAEGAYELYDLLGRKIDSPQPNQVYLQVWKSGKINKIIISE